MAHDLVQHTGRNTRKCRQGKQLAGEFFPADPGRMEQGEEQLLDEHSIGFFEREQVFNLFLCGALDHGAAAEEFAGIFYDPCNKGRLSPPPAPPHPLEKCRDRVRGSDLHNHIQIADINPEFKRARADDTGT